SLWMPVVRRTEITDDGYRGGSLKPERFDGTEQSNEDVRRNIDRAGIVGSQVANDHRSSMLFVPLVDRDPATGKTLDYREFRNQIEQLKRFEEQGVQIYVIGFAQLVGDLIRGIGQVLNYFLLAALITVAIIRLYT